MEFGIQEFGNEYCNHFGGFISECAESKTKKNGGPVLARTWEMKQKSLSVTTELN